MKYYFIDYEVYKDGVVFKWGNCFIHADTTNIREIVNEVKIQIKKDLNVKGDCIRFRKFNRI